MDAESGALCRRFLRPSLGAKFGQLFTLHKGARFGSLCLFLTSVLLMDQTYIKGITRLRVKIVAAPHLYCFPKFPAEEHLTQSRNPSYGNYSLQSRKGQIKPHAKPFKELISRLGQPSELAAPGYEDSTKHTIAHAWRRWTKYIFPCIHRPRPL